MTNKEKIDLRLIDKHVGMRLRIKRTLFGFSQKDLGQRLNITFQQVQKYENGTNRLSASRLYNAGLVLQEPVKYFFEGLPGQNAPIQHKEILQDETMLKNEMHRETLELIRMFYAIREPGLRRHLKQLLKAILAQDDH